jgi:hypothetical protein
MCDGSEMGIVMSVSSRRVAAPMGPPSKVRKGKPNRRAPRIAQRRFECRSRDRRSGKRIVEQCGEFGKGLQIDRRVAIGIGKPEMHPRQTIGRLVERQKHIGLIFGRHRPKRCAFSQTPGGSSRTFIEQRDFDFCRSCHIHAPRGNHERFEQRHRKRSDLDFDDTKAWLKHAREDSARRATSKRLSRRRHEIV